MKYFKKILLISTTISALALGFSSYALSKTLIYCSEASPDGFDPALYTSGTTFTAASKTIYNRLVEFKKSTTDIEPGLAERWDVSDDGLEYTFHLRHGVKFQTTNYFTPTRDLNADDVVFSFERQWKKDNPWHFYTSGVAWQYFDGMEMGSLLKNVQKIDDYTVKFTLNRPEAPFLSDMAMDFAVIVSKEYADKLQAIGQMAQMNSMPVGTGPFIFVNYQKDAVIRYKANPDYFAGKQPIDDLVFAITSDPSVRIQKLKAGECHIAGYPSPLDVPALKSDPKVNVQEIAGLNIAYIAYNTEIAPFNNVKVRQALNMAVNKQAIMDAVYGDAGKIAKNPIPPTMWSFNNDVKDDIYEPKLAKKMLDEAGVKNLKVTILALPVSRLYMPNARRTAELIQADYAKVGVKVDIITADWGQYTKMGNQKGRESLMMYGWSGDNGDPDNFMNLLASCNSIGTNNFARWCYQPYDKLVREAAVTNDHNKRIELYEQAQLIFKQQAPWLIIANSTSYMMMSKQVKNYVMSPLGSVSFIDVDLDGSK